MHLWGGVDLVVSGVNLGLDVGNAMWHSGTLAAAKQGVLLGVRAEAGQRPCRDKGYGAACYRFPRMTDPLVVLASIAPLLADVARHLAPEQLRERPAADHFAFVEHAWHLADLEEEGFGLRITRLLRETMPELPDFHGARLAVERRYLEQSAGAAVVRFAAARAANLTILGGVSGGDWGRSGIQEGVGRVSLADLPRFMAEHDAAHAGELVALLRRIAPDHPTMAALERLAEGARRSTAA